MTDLSQLEKTHRAMLASRAAGRHAEQERRREIRIRRHVVVGVLATIAFFLMIPLVHDFVTYITMVAAMGLALGSFARAVDLRLGYTWGRLYRDPKRVTWLDGLALRILEGRAPDDPAPEPKVRVLTPPS